MAKKIRAKSKPRKATTKKKKSTVVKKKSSSRKPKATTKKKTVKTSRYNRIQKILSEYAKSKGLKLGKSFNGVASAIYNATKGEPLKYVSQNIDVLYGMYGIPVAPIKTFPDGIEFYNFKAELQLPVFDGVLVSYAFNDNYEQFEAEGDRDEVADSFTTSGFYKYLRANYNGSPPNNAPFIIEATDNKTYVKYKVTVFGEPTGGGLPSDTPIEPPTSVKTAEPTPYTAQEVIAIEKEKQKTLKQVEKLMKQGWTKEEILRLLGK